MMFAVRLRGRRINPVGVPKRTANFLVKLSTFGDGTPRDGADCLEEIEESDVAGLADFFGKVLKAFEIFLILIRICRWRCLLKASEACRSICE